MDPTKIKIIISWTTTQSFTELRPFFGIVSFYRRLIRNLRTITSTLTELLKVKEFAWTAAAHDSFDTLSWAPELALPDFNQLFEVECDAFRVGIGAILNQRRHPIAFFNEKLNESRRKYLTYDKEFYAIGALRSLPIKERVHTIYRS
ncbi:uncharacterized protein LOC110034922 [Phalaenopsis equestris]|uniref:uncharacterized protein LOC110034922 n=1 Tax=Phalaenopsis equestris TaxID=78828 RepID=UPI0009E259F4|nr:uncharacterized protein LOC110034922 [Phalaenopsis equestris]